MPNNENISISRMAWNFSQINNDTTEIFIYDVIADKQRTDWWTGEKGTEVTPTLFNEELGKVTTPNICIRVNSGGGDVMSAEAIRTAIREKRQEGKNITCKVDGFCGSAAVGIAAACEKISIPSSGYLMIHDPVAFGCGYFSASDFQKGLSMLEKIKEGIINAYAEKTGKDKQEISQLMTNETWWTGEEAVKNGFADNIMFEKSDTEESEGNPENISLLDVSMYRNIPVSLIDRNVVNMAGFSNTKNKKEGVEDMEINTVEELTTACPELVKEIANSAATAERERIQNIENIAPSGYDDIINKAKYEVPVSAADVAMQILQKLRKQGVAYLADVKADIADSGVGNVATSGQEGADGDADPYLAAIDSELPKTN